MASRQTRAWMAAQGSYYLYALPQIQLSEGELEAAVESAVRGDVELRAVYRKTDNGQAELSAQGYERQVPMALDVAGQRQNWLERRFVVQSLRSCQGLRGGPSRPCGKSANSGGSAQPARPRSQAF
jgi:hypothetical protein